MVVLAKAVVFIRGDDVGIRRATATNGGIPTCERARVVSDGWRRDGVNIGRRRRWLKEEDDDKEEKGSWQLRVCECWLVSASCTLGWRRAKGLAK